MNRPIWRRPLVLWLVPVLAAGIWFVLQRARGPEVAVYRLEARPLVQTVVATGRVITESRVQVGSEITATLASRRVKEGDRVRAGDVLAVLRADDLIANVRAAEAALSQLQNTVRPQAAAALRQAETELAQATRERERRASLIARQLIARETLEQAEEAEAIARIAVDRARLAAASSAAGGTEEQQLRERLGAARAQLGKTTIRAGASGVVLTRNVEPGDLVQPGRVLFTLASQGATEIEVPVDEKNLAALAVGQSAQCVADAWLEKPFAARVTYIAPGVDADRGTVIVRLAVDPVPEFLRQDMTVTVNIETARRESTLAVPNDALPDSPASTLLVVRNERVARVPVKVGLRGLAMSEIVEGVAAGELVLANAAAQSALTPGMRVRTHLEVLPAAGTSDATRRELPVNFD